MSHNEKYSGTEVRIRPAAAADTPTIGRLDDIVVDPSHRGHGVGRLLLDATVAALRDRGAPWVVLETAEGNEAAQHLFAHAGFRRTMIEMTKELS